MDVFLEKIVTKKKTSIIKLKALLIFFVALCVSLTAALSFKYIGLIIALGVIYFSYVYLNSINVEYEYSVTNYDIDIDKIYSQKKRKNIFSGDCRDFEIVAKLNSSKYTDSYSRISDRTEAVSSMKADDVYFIVTNNKKGRIIVFFQPDVQMLECLKKFNPSKIFLE